MKLWTRFSRDSLSILRANRHAGSKRRSVKILSKQKVVFEGNVLKIILKGQPTSVTR